MRRDHVSGVRPRICRFSSVKGRGGGAKLSFCASDTGCEKTATYRNDVMYSTMYATLDEKRAFFFIMNKPSASFLVFGGANGGVFLRVGSKKKTFLREEKKEAMLIVVSYCMSMIGISSRGSGPSVFFASGLCNVMPSSGYSDFLKRLEGSLTIIRDDSARPLSSERLTAIAQKVNVSSFGYVGHSSLAPSLFDCNVISRYVLLDPASFPIGFDLSERVFVSRSVSPFRPVRIMNAALTREGTRPFVPKGFDLRVEDVVPTRFEHTGHADVLDDVIANFCHLGGMEGDQSATNRASYREQLARMTIEFMLANEK